MKNGIENTLKRICLMSGGDAAYLLEKSNLGINLSAVYGTMNSTEKELSSFNKLVTRKKELPLSELKKTPAYIAISKANNFKSVFKEKIFENDSSIFFLVIFTKTKFTELKQLKPKFNQLIKHVGEKPVLPSETKKEENNESSESPLSEIANSIQPVLYSIRFEGFYYNYISEAVRTLFGYSPEDIYENKYLISRSIDKDYINDFNSFMDRLKGGEDTSLDYKMKDRFSKEHWVRHYGTPIIKNGTVQNIVGTIREISEEKSVELKLARSEERFSLLVDTADDLIFILNGFGYFSMVNKSGARALGYSPDEMTGRHFLEFVSKDDEEKIAAAFNQILSTDAVTTFEANFLDRYDKEITFEIHAKPLVADGEVSGMISLGRNITIRKIDDQKIRDLNSKLIEANRIISIERERARHKISVLEELNKLKSEFISNISHELRTPLASIVGFAETIASDPDLPKEMAKEFSGIILSEGKRLAKLINDVLDFSKLESGEDEIKMEPFDIISTIEWVIVTFQDQIKEKDIILTKEFSNNELKIVGDKKRIEQIFINLISNSIKFTNHGGRISILATDYGKELELAVSDTGIGIPDKDLPKLFQKFSKIQRSGAPIAGTGFGLVTVKQIVDLHKGFIRVTSQENKGTTFIIRLPKQQLTRG